MVQGNCTPNLDQIFEQLLFRRDHFYSCCLISLFKISYYNSNNAPPPPLRGPLNKINNRYDTIFSFRGYTIKCPRKPYTKFGPDIQRTCHAIRILSLPVYNSTHHCAMSYRASIRPNVVVPFHRWTTCGPRQLHTKFGPNIRTTSIPAGPLLLMFSYFTIQNFKLQFDPPFAVHSIK